MGVARLHRGVILWVGLLFFSYSTLAVAWLNDAWTARHMGVLASGALAIGSWLTVAIKKPFTLDYARDHTDPSLWNNPAFIRTNVVLASVWASVFTLNAILAWGKMEHFGTAGFLLRSHLLCVHDRNGSVLNLVSQPLPRPRNAGTAIAGNITVRRIRPRVCRGAVTGRRARGRCNEAPVLELRPGNRWRALALRQARAAIERPDLQIPPRHGRTANPKGHFEYRTHLSTLFLATARQRFI